jgi:pilus assembly protein CpaC
MVQRDLSLLVAQVKNLFPGETIEVAGSGKDIVLSGEVTSKYVVEKAAEVAAGYVEKKENVVNLLRQEENVASNQVLLRVRFAEVSRSALQELGVSFFADGRNGKHFGRTTTQQFPAPFFDESDPMIGKSLVFSDYLNLFLFDKGNSLGAVVKALQQKGLFQSLAEPNLIAQNGKEATFLAGGEYPYPAVQGGVGNVAVTIVFKEFGIRLRFVPTVLRDDIINLQVRPEVSALDFTNAVSIQGFRVPALTTRRAETEIELRDGQTFAIAGLLNNTLTETMQKIPGIGDIPVLGLLFRSRALQKAETELVVMITPQILRRNSTGVSDRLPNLVKPYLDPPKETLPSPPPYSPRQSSDAGTVVAPAQPVSNDAAAAAQAAMPAAHDAPPMAPPEAAPKMPPHGAAAGQVEHRQPAPAVMDAPEPDEPVKTERRESAKAAKESAKAEQKARERTAEMMKAQREAEAREAKLAAERARKQAEADRDRAAKAQRAAAEQAERAGKAARKQAELDRKRAKVEAELARKKAEEDKKIAERMAREKAREDAEAAKRAAVAAKRQAEIDKRVAKEMAEANARLRDAQAAYEAELDRVSKLQASATDKTTEPAKQ